jgi:hypothetical protein
MLRKSDSVESALEQASARLDEHLQNVCEPEDARGESVADLLSLEEELLKAAHAARQAASIRRRIEEEGPRKSPEAAGAAASDTHEKASADSEGGVREFSDRTGCEWRVWAVLPGHRANQKLTPYLGEYQHGWLAFEAISGARRKRLPNHPRDWVQLSDRGLEELLSRAVDVTERRKDRHPSTEADSPP